MGLWFGQRFVLCGLGVVETRHALSLRHVGLYVSCLHLMEHQAKGMTNTKHNAQNQNLSNNSIL
jgi:hypothetical protein